MLLLLLFPVLLSALPWAIPRRWLPACGLAVLYAAVYLIIEETRSQCAGCGGMGSVLGWVVFVLACLGFFFSFIARLAVLFLAEEGATKFGASVFSSGATTALAAFGLACVGVWQTVVVMKAWFDDGSWIHGTLVVTTLGWLALGRLYREERGEHGLRIFSGVAAVTTLCALAWSLQVPAKVIAAAEEAAAGAPYCLLTSGLNGLRPARDRLDLAGFAIQDGPVSLHHATLAVGESREPVWRYWFYRRGAFVPEFFRGVPACKLQRNSAKDLSWFLSKADPLDSQF